MSREEDGNSLADKAAAWVPPWSRPAEEPSGQPAEPAAAEQVVEPAAAEQVVEPAAERPESDVKVPASESDWEWDDPDSSDTLDIAAQLEETGEPVVVEAVAEGSRVTEEPGVAEGAGVTGVVEPIWAVSEPVGVVEPEPFVPAEPAVPTEPLLFGGIEGSTVADQPSRASSQIDTALSETQPAAVPTAELRGALEAILLVVDEPVSEIMLAQIVEQPTERVAAALAELAAEYTAQQRGFELRSVAGGWRFYTRTTYAAYVERFVLDGQQVRLTQAALETLAVIAYKQPVTRSRISAIRGVNCDGVVRTLLSRGLIEEMGTEPETGAHLYRTTTLFLEKLGLNSVDELPPLAPFLPDDVEALADAT